MKGSMTTGSRTTSTPPRPAMTRPPRGPSTCVSSRRSRRVWPARGSPRSGSSRSSLRPSPAPRGKDRSPLRSSTAQASPASPDSRERRRARLARRRPLLVLQRLKRGAEQCPDRCGDPCCSIPSSSTTTLAGGSTRSGQRRKRAEVPRHGRHRRQGRHDQHTPCQKLLVRRSPALPVPALLPRAGRRVGARALPTSASTALSESPGCRSGGSR